MSLLLPFWIEHRYSGMSVSVIVVFQQSVTKDSGASWSDGFSILVDNTAAVIHASSSFGNRNHIILTADASAPLSATSEVKVSYNGTQLFINNTPVPSFTNQLSIHAGDTAWVPTSAIISDQSPATITLFTPYLLAATDGFAANPFNITVNHISVSPSSIQYAAGRGRISIHLPGPVSHQAVVHISTNNAQSTLYNVYTESYYHLAQLPVINGSMYGTPSSSTGVSCVVISPLNISSKAITAEVRVYLNPIDREVAKRFTPSWDPSGSYASNNDPNLTITWTDAPQKIFDGAVYTQTFIHDDESFAYQAAQYWGQMAAVRIQLALSQARTKYVTLPTGQPSYQFI